MTTLLGLKARAYDIMQKLNEYNADAQKLTKELQEINAKIEDEQTKEE